MTPDEVLLERMNLVAVSASALCKKIVTTTLLKPKAGDKSESRVRGVEEALSNAHYHIDLIREYAEKERTP